MLFVTVQYMCTYKVLCACACVCVCVCVCMYMCMYVCMCMYICVCVYVCTYVGVGMSTDPCVQHYMYMHVSEYRRWNAPSLQIHHPPVGHAPRRHLGEPQYLHLLC